MNVRLGTPLQRLPRIMLRLILLLRLPVSRQTRSRTSQCSLHTVLHTTSKVAQLTMCLLRLALSVLLNAILLQLLAANQVSQRLLGGSESLVPGSR